MINHCLTNQARRWSIPVVSIVFLVLAATPSFSQSNGTILGVVKDTSGGVVPQAKVTVVNTDTNDTRTATTGDDGAFRFPALQTGHYSVKFEKEGFTTQTQTGLTLEVTQELVLNPSLQVGTSTQQVTVTGEAPVVNTTNSALGALVNEASMADLPLNGRNYSDLTLMQPGVAITANVGGGVISATGGSAGVDISVDGGSIRANMVTLDGANVLNGAGANTASKSGTSLGVAGIKEFKVVTGVFGAEYGQAPAAQVVMVSKGGTNQFHGEAFEYLRNSVLDARNFFDKSVAANNFERLPPLKRNNFGGGFGGPIRKDKTFFYAAYEGLRQRLGPTIIDTLPAEGCHRHADGTDDVAGDVVWNGTGTPPPTGYVGTCTQLGANPGGPNSNSVKIASVMVPYLALYPNPNVLPLSSNQYTFPFVIPVEVDWGQIRVDHNISNSDSLFGRYTTNKANQVNNSAFTQYSTGTTSFDQFVTLSENHIFTPALLNQTRLSYSRTNYLLTNIFNSGGGYIGPQYSYVPGQPMGSIQLSGFSTFGISTNNPNSLIQNILTASDDLFYSKGKHALKFGFTVNRYNIGFTTSSGLYGIISFTNLAGWLQGIPAQWQASGAAPGTRQGNFNTIFWVPGLYAQDDWRVTSRLTVNLGLRYEFMSHAYETNGREYNLHNITDPAYTQGSAWAPFSKLHFSPRVGFAWDVQGNGKTSLRGGFGDYFDIGNMGIFWSGSTFVNPPLNGKAVYNNVTNLVVPIPFTFPANLPQGAALTQYHLQEPYLLKWNLTAERQLPGGMALQVAYVGSRGVHLYRNVECNMVIPTLVNGIPYWNGIEPRVNPLFGSTQCSSSGGESWYHGLQVAVQRRLSRGLEFQLSYTYSHALDITNTSGSSNECGAATGESEGDYFGPGEKPFIKGPACGDLRHVLRLNMLYHIPNIKSDNFAAKMEHGWRLGAIWSAQTGYPFNPILGTQRSQSGISIVNAQTDNASIATAADAAFCAANPASCKYTPVPFDASTVIKGDPSQWYNPNMFTMPALTTTPGGTTVCTAATCIAGSSTNPPWGTVGYIQRGLLRGPGLENVDVSLSKDTHLPFLGEQGNLEFRAELFNILNHPNLGMPNGTVFTGKLTDYSPYSEAPSGSAGVITYTTTTARLIQFALKLVF